MPAVSPAFMTVAEAVTVLGIPERTFFRDYLRRFTDTRPADKRRAGVPHRLRRAEVELVVNAGWEALAQLNANRRRVRS